MFYTNTHFSDIWCADSRIVKSKLNFVVVQNLNWILRFEVYAHSDGHPMPQYAIVKQRVLGVIFVSCIAHNIWWS